MHWGIPKLCSIPHIISCIRAPHSLHMMFPRILTVGGHASPLHNVMSSFSPTTCDQPGVWVQGLPIWTEGAWGANAGVEGMNVLCGDFRRPTMELLSPMAVMSEGLGFNLCVVPFLNVCVLNLFWGVRVEDIRGGRSWVRGVVLESEGRRLKLGSSEDES